MSRLKKIKILFWAAVASLALLSLTFSAMPHATRISEATNKVSILIVGGAFWFFLAVSCALIIWAIVERKRFMRFDANRRFKTGKLPGVITFFRNVPAIVADVIMILSAVAFVLTQIVWEVDLYLQFYLLSLLVLSVNMHSMFNGKIYRVTKYKAEKYKKRGKEL